MIRQKAIIAFTLMVVLFLPALAKGEQRPDVHQFMNICGIENGLRSSTNYYRNELKKKYPELPKSFYKELDLDLRNYVSYMMKFYVKTYSEAFSPQDMKQILSFFSTPIGQKFSKFNNKSLPAIAQYASAKMQTIDQKVETELKKVR